MNEFIESFAFEKSNSECDQQKQERIQNEEFTHISKKAKYDENIVYDINTENLKPPFVLVFDTETSSLNGSVIQLAWILADCCGNIVDTYCEYWKLPKNPTNFEKIDPRAQEIHGITEEVLSEKGLDPTIEVDKFIRMCRIALMNGCIIVAHNANFDVARINHTAVKHNISKKLDAHDMFCTMKNSTARCGLLKINGRTKAPTNSELHFKLVGKLPTENLHDALEDCRVTLKSYIQGCIQGWW